MKNLKILHYSKAYPFTVVYELAKKQIDAGHEVGVYCWPGMSRVRAGITLHENIQVYCLGVDVHTNPTRFKLAPFKVLRELSDLNHLSKLVKRFDIVHIHGPTFYTYPKMYEKIGTAGWGIAARLTKTPAIWTFHGHTSLVKKYRKSIVSEMKYSTISTAVNPLAAKMLGVTFIPNGVDTNKFRPIGEDMRLKLRAKYGLPDDKLLVISVGRWIPRKGQDILATYLSSLDDNLRKKIHLLLVGPIDIGHIDYYKTVINTLRSSQFSFTTIHAAQEELPIFYAISDVFVLMSRDEGDPLVLLEAMSSGLPCITSGVGSFRMQQGVEMFIATTRDEFKKQIEALLHDSYLRKKVGEAARLSVLKHDWSEITKMYMALYEEAINSA